MTPLTIICQHCYAPQNYVATKLAGTMDAYDAQMRAMQRAVTAPAATITAPKKLSREDLCSKEFQLEELEDKEECETEVWLNDDGSVSLVPQMALT